MPAPKILIVDDEKHLVTMLQRILVKMNYDVAIANTGLQALDQADRYRPDLILLDIKMPGMDGIEVLKTLRANPLFTQTPIVVLSAKCQLHEINAGLDAGANKYLCKPVMFDEIFETIQKFIIAQA